MKLIGMCISVDEQGCLVLPREPLAAMGLKPGDGVSVTLAAEQEGMESLCPQLIITPPGVGVALQLLGMPDDEEEADLTLSNELLEAAEIPVGSDLEVLCTTGAIVVTASDILNNLPHELRGLFDELGIDPGTVREVMRKEGYYL
jgi:bifunctional DNA-binding transcriptional regulator/antitoxin component of YhaV-PrlF toxin-antitoxin module